MGPAGAVVAIQTLLLLLWVSGIVGLALLLVLMAASLLVLYAFRWW